jgi:hypothetical protein
MQGGTRIRLRVRQDINGGVRACQQPCLPEWELDRLWDTLAATSSLGEGTAGEERKGGRMSKKINTHTDVYWPIVLDVTRRFNVTRIKKCCQIMGRKEGSLTAAQVLYPLMQCTDIFFLKADICQLGNNQRKVNMLARKYCHHAAKDKKRMHKPVILSHYMLYGLKEGQEMMSKSNPNSAEFMEDSAEDVERKIRSAYCPTTPAAAVPAPATAPDVGRESMHLAKDNNDTVLKNLILNYVRRIALSSPGCTLACCCRCVAVDDRGTTDATKTSTMTAGEGGGWGRQAMRPSTKKSSSTGATTMSGPISCTAGCPRTS